MRDDDDIRLYMPVLQRIIILVAVIIAVPVVMWTITALVRTYVGPPQLPTFQRVTEAEQPGNTAGAPQTEFKLQSDTVEHRDRAGTRRDG